MASTWQCSKCGLDLTDTSAKQCPVCGTGLASPANEKVWWVALLQIALCSAFILAFGFPRFMIPTFAGIILLVTAFSSNLQARSAAVAAPQRPISHPVRFRILSLGIALSSFGLLAILVFGFAIFMNSWSRWHLYQGASFQQTDFQVTQAYYQKHTRGGADIFASGIVDGQREWMNLQPCLRPVPHDQAELDERLPAGTVIPVYLFPGLKGRSRIQIFEKVPPAEAYRHKAMTALKDGLCGLALIAGIIYLLGSLRNSCFETSEIPAASTPV